jgi:DNA recombination protein RmuC
MDFLIWIVGAFSLGALLLSYLVLQRVNALTTDGPKPLRELAASLNAKLDALSQTLSALDTTLRSEQREQRSELTTLLSDQRRQSSTEATASREELRKALNDFSVSLKDSVASLNEMVRTRLGDLGTQQNQLSVQTLDQLEKNRATVEQRLVAIQNQNETKLEEMRKTVDEKLQSTLEKRLGESFKLVSDRLEQVHKGLGEMQNLATGVGNLSRVLTNVKVRGGMGEMQLAKLLEDFLTPEQYIANARIKKSTQQMVEFAVRLPDCLLAIDSKFPLEDYQRLMDAYDAGAIDALESERKALFAAIRKAARDIRDKYIDPPTTTDFAILFVPFEGLYAEIIRSPGLLEQIREESKVIVTGPTNLAAFLSSLQMGFRTLAIQKQSSEVWKLLSAVKTEFGRFGEVLAATRTSLEKSLKNLEGAEKKVGHIEKRMKAVQELPISQAQLLLTDGDAEEVEPESE